MTTAVLLAVYIAGACLSWPAFYRGLVAYDRSRFPSLTLDNDDRVAYALISILMAAGWPLVLLARALAPSFFAFLRWFEDGER